jgi:hypothetical protein
MRVSFMFENELLARDATRDYFLPIRPIPVLLRDASEVGFVSVQGAEAFLLHPDGVAINMAGMYRTPSRLLFAQVATQTSADNRNTAVPAILLFACFGFCHGASRNLSRSRLSLIQPPDIRTDSRELLFDLFVTPVDVVRAVDSCCSFGD